jgi:hypothetical protein
MGDQRLILDYAPPPRSKMERLVSMSKRVVWLTFKRPLHDVETATAGWFLLAITYLVHSSMVGRVENYYPLLVLPLIPPLIIFTWSASRLAIAKRWRVLTLVAVLYLSTGPITGLVQFDQCPHAAYVQICGVSIPISGDACGNPRDVRPWWMRD